MKHITPYKIFEEIGESDTFSFFTRKYDVSKIWKMIQANPMKYKNENGDFYTIDVSEINKYISNIKTGEDGKSYFNMGVSVNKEYAKKLTDTELQEPGIFILDDGFNFLIDGWHRAYALFEKGINTMQIWLVRDMADIEKIRL